MVWWCAGVVVRWWHDGAVVRWCDMLPTASATMCIYIYIYIFMVCMCMCAEGVWCCGYRSRNHRVHGDVDEAGEGVGHEEDGELRRRGEGIALRVRSVWRWSRAENYL